VIKSVKPANNVNATRKGTGLPPITSFGYWIKRRRKALDITQEELAQRVGCSVSTIVKIEADERRPSRQMAELFARHLDIPTDQHDLFLKVARQDKRIDRLSSIPALEDLAPSAPFQQPQSKLPIFPTSFVGRKHEIDVLVNTLLDPACRLVTLTGPGGIGKTRFAVEAARRLEAKFGDGVYYFPMAGVRLPESILPTIADGLGLVFSGPAEPLLQILTFLRNKQSLLVFDNMEHLLDGWMILEEILRQAPEIKLLLTSRAQLQLQWEWIFELQGLPVPEALDFSNQETNSAALLFLQRARQASQGFSLEDEDAEDLLQILKLVDGLPLAIELAAAWAPVMTVGEIAQELERNIDLLATTRQDISDQHRSIRTVFDHSWKLLTDEEQLVLMRLSVFSGGFSRAAADSVAGASLLLLSSLIGKSLLRHQKETGRYDLHELTRQYALARLHTRPDEEAQIYEKHSRYYASWLASLEAPLKSEQQIQTSLLIHAETANWIAAWQWGVNNQRLAALREMAPCLYWYYEIHGYYAEALAAYHLAVKEFRAVEAPQCLTAPEEKSAFAFLVDQLGWFEFRTGNIEQAAALFAESLELASIQNDPEVLYHIYGNWGYMELLKGDISTAKRLTLECLACAEAMESQWHIAIPANVLGIVEMQQGNLEQAQQDLTAILKTWRAVGDPRGLIFCMLYLSSTALALGDFSTAESVLEESNAIARQKRDRWALAFGLDLLGQAAMAQGRFDEAGGIFDQSLVLSREIGDLWASNRTLIHLAEAQAATGISEETRQLFREAYLQAQQAKWTPNVFEALVAFLSVDSVTALETRLAALMEVLSHPGISAPIRQRAEVLRDRWVSELTFEQLEMARAGARGKSLEDWAQEILGV
jgi:predicted ATPase/transcriptional regulator with XRE-family HTH domain